MGVSDVLNIDELVMKGLTTEVMIFPDWSKELRNKEANITCSSLINQFEINKTVVEKACFSK